MPKQLQNVMKRPLKDLNVVFLLAIIFRVTISVSKADNETSTCFNANIVIKRLVDPDKYDKAIRPCEDGKPVVVYAGMYIVSINKVQESDMELDIQVYFRQKWKDPRLAYGSMNLANISDKDYIDLSPGYFWDAIWMPDPYFENEKRGRFHTIMRKNQLLRLYGDGTVFLSSRLTLTLACPMEFDNFPMDKQICKVEFLSYGQTTRNIQYKWLTNKTETSVYWNKLELPQFNISKIETASRVDTYSVGDFSVLTVSLHLQRRMEFYLTRNYIPAAMVVIVSWLSFWVDRDCAPARVGMGITTILTMTTLLIGVGEQELPVVSYMKALDWYYIGCFVFVFVGLCEYAIVNYFDSKFRRCHIELQRKKTVNLDKGKDEVNANRGTDNYGFQYGNEFYPSDVPKKTEEANINRQIDVTSYSHFGDTIDNGCRIIHPLMFLIFNIVYWLTYRASLRV